MDQITVALRRRAVLAFALGALVVFALGACGGSSSKGSSSGTQTNAAATSPSTDSSTTGTGSGATKGGAGFRPRVSALRECLQRNGIKLPQKGSTRSLFNAGANLPAGVSRSQLQAAVRKCLGGRFPAGGPRAGALARVRSPAFRKALSSFAACMRQNGVAVPTPNTSGGGPIFDTKGLNTASPQFRTALTKCRQVLSSAFARHP